MPQVSKRTHSRKHRRSAAQCHTNCGSRGYIRSRCRKKWEDYAPVWVVQLVGALLFVGNRWRNDAMDARQLATTAAGTGGVSAAGDHKGRLQAQGDLAETGAEQQGVQQGACGVSRVDAIHSVGDGCDLEVATAKSRWSGYQCNRWWCSSRGARQQQQLQRRRWQRQHLQRVQRQRLAAVASTEGATVATVAAMATVEMQW